MYVRVLFLKGRHRISIGLKFILTLLAMPTNTFYQPVRQQKKAKRLVFKTIAYMQIQSVVASVLHLLFFEIIDLNVVEAFSQFASKSVHSHEHALF